MRNPARYRHGTCRLRRRRPALAALAAGLILSVLAALGGGGGAATAGEAGADDPSKDRRNWISFEPIGEPFLHTLFLRRAEIEIVEPELATGEMLEYLPAGATTPIDWRELYFVKRAMPRAEILDHLAHGRWDALFDPGNRPSDLDDAPGLVVTDPRWTAINRKCPGILLVERKADGRDLKMGVNIVDGKLRIAPSLLRFYKVDLDKDGKLEDAIIKGYNGVYTYSKRHIKKIEILNVYECKIVSRVSVHFNGSVDFFILDNIYYMSNGRPLYYSNRILGFVEKENGGIREWTFGDIYGILTIKEFMERNLYINPYYFGRLTDGERKALKGGSDD